MMNRAKGPVWHKKDKERNIVPKKLHGLDKQATWSKSAYDNWVYGHGSFCIVTHDIPVVGCFMWMRNSANEAKRMYQEARHYAGILDHLVMDSKADDQHLLHDLKEQYNIQLVTSCRKHMDKSPSRKHMIALMNTHRLKQHFRQRSKTVEPMQGLIKDIFDIDRCWMRRDDNNRWLFAAMGLAVQIHQLDAYRNQRSTWNIKTAVLGEA